MTETQTTEFTSTIVESLGAEIFADAQLFEITLHTDQTFTINAEDGDGCVVLDGLNSDQLEELHELIGHMLYVYRHQD